MRIVQLKIESEVFVAMVDEPNLRLINKFKTVYDLANSSLNTGLKISEIVSENLSETLLDYDEICYGQSDYQLITPIHHPIDPRFLMVSGTGLTHSASAENRNKMHEAINNNVATDSMKMYQIGVDGGKPNAGKIGAQAEWFYKGNGTVLKAHNETLSIPNYANDGGEEPEIAGIYINDLEGKPHRIGFTTANEFSDHFMEKKNYLYLAPSKIRNCSIGPELVLDAEFSNISGNVSIKRNNEIIWQRDIATGEENMCHSLENLEYHHFKYENHRIPGDIHVHYFGTVGFSFGAGIVLKAGDEMKISWEKMGRPLINKLEIDNSEAKMFNILQL
jgi:hypothetical protein